MSPPPPGWRLQHFESLDSTQTLCRRLAEAGEPERLAVVARRQTGGRGTQGRAWVSPPGNLFLSVLLRPTEPARAAAQWSLLAAVALIETLTPHTTPHGARLRLKWPNDVLRDGAKLAGILTESGTDAAGGLAWLVIGVGVNVATAPELADRPTSCLGGAIEAADLVGPFLTALDRWRHLRLRDGFAPIRAAWLARAPDLGSHISLRRGDATLVGGAFAGLDEEGHLLLSAGGRVRAFASGETA